MITVRISNQQIFEQMSEKDHATMKRRLKALAKTGARKPAANTIEGYCLNMYTTKESAA